VVAAYALAGSEERGHLVVTAPTGGSAGVIPALVYAFGEGGRKLPQQKIRDGMLAAAAVGLCKHNATLSEPGRLPGGDRRGVGDGRGPDRAGARLRRSGGDFQRRESSPQHHLGMRDPAAGFVQVPCIERCAFGAVKSWTGFLIASNEIPSNRRRFRHDGDRHGAHRQEMNSSCKKRRRAGWRSLGALC
jgi:L-serine dehydratase